MLATSAWLLQYYYHQQLVKEKIHSLYERDAIKLKYLKSFESYKDQKLDALAEKVGQLQVQSIYLNSLGERLIEKSELPKEEFEGLQMIQANSDEETEQSNEQAELLIDKSLQDKTSTDNSDTNTDSQKTDLDSLNKDTSALQLQLESNQNLLQQLEITYNNLHLVDELYVSGRPVPELNSWISSPFGTRRDPFSGRLQRHKGVDIAGPTGMPIIATAAGVVVMSEARSGYGYVVVINHGNGLMTRYAHASSLVVEVGAVVEKGQQIAVMGTTGRSTGPHVHYEVIKNGRQINPMSYIQRLAS